MAKYTHLSKAPITEALIDIRIKPRESLTVEKLDVIYKSISDKYPERRERRQFAGRIQFAPGASKSEIDKDIAYGYWYVSADKKQIVQARLDGFTFSRLTPYETWGNLRDEAQRLWIKYAEITSPEITRVALKYINKIEIPNSDAIDFDDYLTAGPIVPSGLPQGIGSFFTRVVLHEPQIDVASIITQAFEQIVDPRFVPIILDIDVFKQNPQAFSERDAWELLEKMRDFKNKIFFESITEKLKELFL